MNVSQIISKVLTQHKVEYVFGIPGAQVLTLFDALGEEKSIKLINPTTELSASFMADGYARASGRPGVLVVVPGPGLALALSGIGEALLDHVPMVILAADVADNLPYQFQLHQIPQTDMAAPLAKSVYHINNTDTAQEIIIRAFEDAVCPPPGPVIVNVASNILQEKASPPQPVANRQTPAPAISESIVLQAAEIIQKSKQPGLLVGWGCMDFSDRVLELAQRLQAPVATTLSGRGVVPEDHPLCVGYGFGSFGTPVAEKIFRKCDLVIALAVRFSEVGTGSYGLPREIPLLHVDADPGALDANWPSRLSVVSDVGKFLDAVLERIQPREPNHNLLNRIKQEKEKYLQNRELTLHNHKNVDPGMLVRTWRALLPRDAIVTTDAGAHMFWVLEHFDVFTPRTFLAPVDFQSMGFSVPAAIGAALAKPEKVVLCTVGDGGFIYTGLELLTAVNLQLNVKILIFNDGYLGLIRQFQQKIFRHEVAVKLNNPDFKYVAHAINSHYILVKENEDIAPAVAEALAVEGPVIMEALVSYDHVTRYIKSAMRTNIKRTPLSIKLELLKKLLARM